MGLKRGCPMKEILFLIIVAFMINGCVVYPGYNDGYNDPGYSSYPYGYVNPGLDLYFSNFHSGHGFHHSGHGSHRGGGWRH